MRLLTRPRRWRGAAHLPDGPFLIVANHLSVFDPFPVLHFLVEHDVYPCVLAKASLWRVPGLGWLLRQIRAVPVHRNSAVAVEALHEGEAALADGYAVLLFPEGTTTTDPDLWPIPAKTGAARMALRTGVAVIPLAHWGAQQVIPNRGGAFRPLPPKAVDVVVGPPIDLDDLRDRPDDPHAWAQASNRIMERLREQLEQIRLGEP